MQELTFEQVEVVSGGYFHENGEGWGTEGVAAQGAPRGQQFIVGNIIGGVAGAIAGALTAIMHHSGKGTGEGTPLSDIVIGATGGFIMGFVSPAKGVSEAARHAGAYTAVGVAGYVINGAGNP